MKRIFVVAFLLCLGAGLWAQHDQPGFTPALERVKSFEQRKALIDQSLVANIPFRNIGPAVQSGRVVELAVNPKDPSIFYVAYASGGLWKTESNGTSFTPLFDQEMVMTIGAIAVDWENDVIWVGTGEVNSSRSSYAGTGVFKSTDGGKSWQYLGLGESHHIGRIVLDPGDPNVAQVAVLGHLYSPNKERGVYKTKDGGKTWTKTLFVNDNAGAVDLIADPNNPSTYYAAIWERSRRANRKSTAGQGSGIYKSTDGGENWSLVSGKKSKFPTGEGVGRIGLSASNDGGKTALFAILDNYDRRPKEDDDEEKGLTKDDLREMSREDFLKLEKAQIEGYLSENNFPKKYAADKVIEMVKSEKILPVALVEYVEDANSLLFDTPVIGAEVYRSDDGGKSWKKTHEGYLDQVYNSYGYYFGQVRTAPNDPQKVYIMGVPVLRSDDGGANWKSINGDNVCVDHHALWVDTNRPGHLILGNDGGINISYDDGESWFKCNSPAVGQFYSIAVDMEEPYNVYGGLQDNGVWYGPSTYEASDDWHNSGKYPYDMLLGGDGMQVGVDTRDNNIIYTGFQFGNYFRINKQTGRRDRITPKHELGERPLRWNWQSPVQVSRHNQDIIYFGSNKLHRSFNQGDDFEAISGDLTKGGKKGDVAYGTLTTIHESDLRFGLLYTGSDDGKVYVTKDGGTTWQDISTGLPEEMWISRVQASAHQESRVYVSLNGYRWDDFRSMVYMSENYGKTWSRIGKDLPLEPVNVLKEDPRNEDLLYVGTDNGVYCSLDRGKTFMAFQGELPAVAVHDLVIHPTANELILGTHGRSMFIGSVAELQQLNAEQLQTPLLAFKMDEQRYSGYWGQTWADWLEAEDPEVAIPVYSNAAGKATIEIYQGELKLNSLTADLSKGLNYISYHLDVTEEQVEAYTAALNA
ncbi:MAG: glycosyl hydrolase, partial [Phaeodactylibacter sp.]|nr:glycosyl hydrolase [Phaeodactylibacter sp.]